MKKNKVPVISYFLYVIAALLFVYGLFIFAENCATFSQDLATYTFSGLTAAEKREEIGLLAEPILTYGFQIVVLFGLAHLCNKKGGDNAAVAETDEEVEEATFGTVLDEEDLEEAKNMVEAAAVEQSASAPEEENENN